MLDFCLFGSLQIIRKLCKKLGVRERQPCALIWQSLSSNRCGHIIEANNIELLVGATIESWDITGAYLARGK